MKDIYVKISIGDNMFTKNKKQHGIMWAIGISLLFTLLQGFIYAIFYSIGAIEGLSYFLTYIIILTILIFKFKDDLTYDIKNIKEDLKGNIKKIILIHILFIICMYISNLILYSLLGDIANNEESIRNTLSSSPILMSLSICILGPLMEELIYRYPYKNIKTNRLVAFATYTLLFAMLHIVASTSLLDLLYIIPYTFLSLSFSYPFYKTNNIISSMFFHILNNTFTVIILFTLGG